MGKRLPAPRMFCDICDEFDKHETEDCPLQASDEHSLTPPPGIEKKERKIPSPRKYCESCESRFKLIAFFNIVQLINIKYNCLQCLGMRWANVETNPFDAY